jgi:DNA-binding MarR family transcriptional regulator/GNAT superfamily N-acetyltransferase
MSSARKAVKRVMTSVAKGTPKQVPTASITSTVDPARIDEVRRFNRFYTREIGVLEQGHLHSEFSLAAVRLLYELAHWNDNRQDPPTATDVAREMGLDAGYLSRLLRDLVRRRLVRRAPSPADARQHHLRLTPEGRRVFTDLEKRASADIAALLAPLSDGKQRLVVDALRTVHASLAAQSHDGVSDAPSDTPAFIIRPPRAGDLGWVVARHGAVYAQEYDWNVEFEGLVARVVADYVEHHDPEREACWIAERDGENVGSIFLVRHPERAGVAKLRLLLVEPSARGLGVGRRLVEECTRFARKAGYHTITLWTNKILVSALRIYAAAGYKVVNEEPHHSFGHDLVSQTWELEL